MIRVQRGREPSKLAALRKRELTALRKARRAHPKAELQVPGTYSLVKRQLWEAQHYKCCYCENLEQEEFNDIEHYRPKLEADRQPGSTERHGYWWLAWTWTNLLFACAACNRSHKRTRFPLAPGSKALKAEQQPPQQEKPLLIDPASQDPLLHLQFRPFLIHGEQQWLPVARNGSPRGQATIEVLKLDRQGLLTLYKAHVDREVRPKVDAFRQLMRAARSRQRVQEAWSALTRELLDARRPFMALSYDALDHLVPEAERRHWGLHLLSA